jgi:hypothetical protein
MKQENDMITPSVGVSEWGRINSIKASINEVYYYRWIRTKQYCTTSIFTPDLTTNYSKSHYIADVSNFLDIYKFITGDFEELRQKIFTSHYDTCDDPESVALNEALDELHNLLYYYSNGELIQEIDGFELNTSEKPLWVECGGYIFTWDDEHHNGHFCLERQELFQCTADNPWDAFKVIEKTQYATLPTSVIQIENYLKNLPREAAAADADMFTFSPFGDYF